MTQHIEVNPAPHLTVGTVGEPGNRTFYLQGGRGSELATVTIEKMQATALVDSFEQLLKELSNDYPQVKRDLAGTIMLDLRLRQPISSMFRVGSLGLGFNEEVWRIIVVAYEMVAKDEEPNFVSYWIRPKQAELLIEHTRNLVSSGRPICGNCGNPIDKAGHFCPHRNGYIK